jgi:glycerol kinase
MWPGPRLDSTKADMMQTMLEGIALLAAEVIDSMHKAAPLFGAISINGGLSNNSYFIRFLARVLGRSVALPASAELTALGSAQLAMIGAGACDIDSMPAESAERRRETGEPPLPAQAQERFRSAVERCKNWR